MFRLRELAGVLEMGKARVEEQLRGAGRESQTREFKNTID